MIEGAEVGQDAADAHDGQAAQRVEQAASGSRHLVAAKADAFDAGARLPQRPQQVGAVQIAARLAGAEENAHEWPPCPGGRVRLAGNEASENPKFEIRNSKTASGSGFRIFSSFNLLTHRDLPVAHGAGGEG